MGGWELGVFLEIEETYILDREMKSVNSLVLLLFFRRSSLILLIDRFQVKMELLICGNETSQIVGSTPQRRHIAHY